MNNNTLASLHHSLQGVDLGDAGADIITSILIRQVEEVAEKFEPQNDLWEKDILHTLRLCKGVEKGSKSAQAYILAVVRDRWQDLNIEFRRNYSFTFDTFVLRETDWMPSTCDNYLRSAKTFFIDKKAPDFPVEITSYDEYRRPILKDGKPVKRLEDFNPAKCDITKLNLVRPLVEQGKMTKTLWNMTADREVTVDALKKEIYGKKENDEEQDTSLCFKVRGTSIVAVEFGEEVEIGEIFFEMGTTELGRSAIRRLLMLMGVEYEEDVLARMIQSKHDDQIIRIYNNGGSALLEEREEIDYDNHNHETT